VTRKRIRKRCMKTSRKLYAGARNGSNVNQRDRLRGALERDIARRFFRDMIRHRISGWFGFVALAFLFVAAGVSGRAQGPQWVGTWAAPPMLAQGGMALRPFAAVTLREIAHVSNGGQQVRVRGLRGDLGGDGLRSTPYLAGAVDDNCGRGTSSADPLGDPAAFVTKDRNANPALLGCTQDLIKGFPGIAGKSNHPHALG